MDTKEKIVNSAIELFKEMGYDQVSIPKFVKKQELQKEHFITIFKIKVRLFMNILNKYLPIIMIFYLKY